MRNQRMFQNKKKIGFHLILFLHLKMTTPLKSVIGLPGQSKDIPSLHEFIEKRDFSGAITLLEFQEKNDGNFSYEQKLWLAYCAFHGEDYNKAGTIYTELIQSDDGEADKNLYLYLSCCYYWLHQYEDCLSTAQMGPESNLQKRLLIHAANQLERADIIRETMQSLSAGTLDNMSLAAIHTKRGSFTQALNNYQAALREHNDYKALQILLAMCSFRQNNIKMAYDVTNLYLRENPDSIRGICIKAACVALREGPQAGLQILHPLLQSCPDDPMVINNLVALRNGEEAHKLLRPLIDSGNELSRINLAINYLSKGQALEALQLVNAMTYHLNQYRLVQAAAFTAYGQLEDDGYKYFEHAAKLYKTIGESKDAKQTANGRKAMASFYLLDNDYKNAALFLDSIAELCEGEDPFHHNYGIALAAYGNFDKALEELLKVQVEDELTYDSYLAWLCRCFIKCGRPQDAWNLYHKCSHPGLGQFLLHLIANDCFEERLFYFAAKTFSTLERLNPDDSLLDGKIASIAGCFRQIVRGEEPTTYLSDLVDFLRESMTERSQQMIIVIKKWAQDNNVELKF
eukprot:TRINITY_DN2196_c1_g1_i1.p1 TRINITY_DN2196_c1_g1~~TRINITY_DN2196_c1_g1_i1.p1  ORF type:complete len:572 (+),score=143.42 TRINITY_DN2196_c1_g1_i1:816-2531(+)